MRIRYRMELLPALKKAGYTALRMRNERIMGERTIQQIRKGELVSWAAMEKICHMLQCQPGDILEYVEDETEGEQSKAQEGTPEDNQSE